jgi:hypothetical protein
VTSEFIPSPNFTAPEAAVAHYDEPRTFKAIVIHWWGDPNTHPKIDDVIREFQNSAAELSAHYVVNDLRTVQMVDEADIAWHAKQANPFSIGIECDPNGGEAMYKRLGDLVNDIRSRRGVLPLEPHHKYVETQCPGWTDLPKIDQYANQGADMTKQQATDLALYLRLAAGDSVEHANQTSAYDVAHILADPGYAAAMAKQIYQGNEQFRWRAVNYDALNTKLIEARSQGQSSAPSDYDQQNNTLLKQILAIVQWLKDKIASVFK